MSKTPTPAGSQRLRPGPLTRPSGTGCPAYSETLPRVGESAVVARRLVGQALGVWHRDALADAARLVVTELVANAVEHAEGANIRVTITRLDDGGGHVGVADKSGSRPERRVAQPDDVGGRGLALVDHMATAWGSDPLPDGKRVWAVVSA